MKKKIRNLIYPLGLMGLLTMLTISCTKDTTGDAKNLTGTTWKFSDTNNGVNLVETIKFTSSTVFSGNDVYTGESNSQLSLSGNYSYNPPNINIVINNETYTGTISGAAMCLTTKLWDVNVYIKQQ
jgi:hypothetical protein